MCGRGGSDDGLHSVPSFPVFMFWITGTKPAPPDVTETCCIRTCHCVVEAVRFSTAILPNGSDERQESGQIKAGGCWFESGWCVEALTANKVKLFITGRPSLSGVVATKSAILSRSVMLFKPLSETDLTDIYPGDWVGDLTNL